MSVANPSPSLLRADVDAWRAGAVTWDGLITLVAARYGRLIDAFAPRRRAPVGPPLWAQA